jgi:hypothetical protein
MSALGQKRTFHGNRSMSALPPNADMKKSILGSRITKDAYHSPRSPRSGLPSRRWTGTQAPGCGLRRPAVAFSAGRINSPGLVRYEAWHACHFRKSDPSGFAA